MPIAVPGPGSEMWLHGQQGKHGHVEIFTYSQTDFLALSAWEHWCQIHSFLCRRENAMQWQWAQNRTERKCLNLGPFFHHLLFLSAAGLWSCLGFVNSFSSPTPRTPSPHCVLSMGGFSHSRQIPKEDQPVRPECSQLLVFTDKCAWASIYLTNRHTDNHGFGGWLSFVFQMKVIHKVLST